MLELEIEYNSNVIVENEIFTYSQIISPVDYNRIMSDEHLYISASDKFLADCIRAHIGENASEVVELGCGPGRVLPLVRKTVPYAQMTAVDADSVFALHSMELMSGQNVEVVIGDVATYHHKALVDVFYSQGFHHHVSKGKKTRDYLKNVRNQLCQDGVYLLSDEFFPDYTDINERETKAVIWYSHIISHALLHQHNYLAQEEAKTLLDDLYEGRISSHVKSGAQIDYVLSRVTAIDTLARKSDLNGATLAAKDFLHGLEARHSLKIVGDVTTDLSRHDYKICEKVLKQEIEEVGFSITNKKAFGPIDNIGAMVVYELRKSR